MSTVPITPDAAPAARAHRATTTDRLGFKPAPHSERTVNASLPKGMPVVVTTDELGTTTLHASIDGIEDYLYVGAADTDFTDSELDPEPPTPAAATQALAAPVPAGLAPWALPAWADDVTVADDVVLLSHVAGVTKCRPPFTDRPARGLLVTVESTVELVTVAGTRYARPPAAPYLRIESPMSSEITATPDQARALAALLLTAADLADGVAA